MIDSFFILISAVVVLALTFDFINGFHDTANTIATSISTKAMPPRVAIALASTMNFLGALAFTGVAKTIGGKIADPLELEYGMVIVAVALVSAIIWNLVTWYFGIPSSSSHALIGSLSGAVLAAAGLQAVNFEGLLTIFEALILSPVVAFTVGFMIMSLIKTTFKNKHPAKMNRSFRLLQIFTAAWQAFSHGTNDAQKSMGIITFALVAGGFQAGLDVPLWVKISCAFAMALGTSMGGWRIIKTIGTRIIKLDPASGFAADFSSATIIIVATLLKLPVSTTHVISSSIMGVGSARRFSSVRWSTAQKMAVAWMITMPITALGAGIMMLVVSTML